MKKLLALIIVTVMMIGVFASCEKPATGGTDLPVTDAPIIDQPIVTPDNNGGVVDDNDVSDDVVDDEDEDDGDADVDDEGEETCDHEGGDDATCVTESICDLCNEPYGGVDRGNHEGEAEWVTTDGGHKKVYTCCETEAEEESAHTFENGVCTVCEYECPHEEDDGHSCTSCGAFVAHQYQNGVCTVCELVRNGNSVTFGTYPQSKVTNSTLKTTLNGKAGTPTTNTNWSSYNYEENSKMWYIDVEQGGEKYRGVYFSQYRPTDINNPALADNSLQDDNGFALNTVHWFRFDPIEWTIISEDTAAKKALVICNMIVDAQAYDTTSDNNYGESTIRKWLNEAFIETAFNELQRAIIVETEVDNSDKSIADYSGNQPFLCPNTNDKIFLLAKGELKDADYGFNGNSDRIMKVTEYAKSQGAYASASNVDWWWTRTPSYDSTRPTKSDLAHNLKTDGSIWSSNVYLTSGGVVPAMWIYV